MGKESKLKAPFPYFGGKSKVASVVWEALGDVYYYLEPFCGSAAVLLGRPTGHKNKHEIINDKDCMISNFWRSVKADPSAVAKYADFPVSHADQMAWHRWLMTSPQALSMREKIIANPKFYDTEVAGYWVWGLSCWIGRGWCTSACVESKKLPHLWRPMGIHGESGTTGDPGFTCRPGLIGWLKSLAARLANVTILCSDWKQGFRMPTILKSGCGIFLDPPYSAEAWRNNNIYSHESLEVTHEVRSWCFENEKVCRIVLDGYDGEHNELGGRGWCVRAWNTQGGYAHLAIEGGNTGLINRHRERLWLSPLCNPVADAVPPPPDFVPEAV